MKAIMISPEKIEEWIHEVEERPASGGLIIRYIANRLSELTSREEELAAKNIELLSGRRVEEYESRIASLEYQLELLKRQLGGEVNLPSSAPIPLLIHETISLLVFTALGEVIRRELEPQEITSGQMIGRLTDQAMLRDVPISLLGTSS